MANYQTDPHDVEHDQTRRLPVSLFRLRLRTKRLQIMSGIELVFRVAAFTLLCMLSLMLWQNRGNNRSHYHAAILSLGIASYMLAPLVMQQWQWGMAGYPIVLLAIVVPALFWYFANAVFDDDFVPRPWVKWLLVATALLGFGAFCDGAGSGVVCQANLFPFSGWMAQTAKLLWIGAALVTVLNDWQADLVESRRRLRLLIVVAGGCYMAAIVIVELLLQNQVTAAVELVHVGVLLCAVTALCIHFLGINQANVFARIAKSAPQEPQPISSLSPMAAQVVALMEHDRAYASDPLTIASLAVRLRTQPYQLRQVVNGELGYRNFNAFINLYRIKEVARRLEQAEYRSTPLLTLALDAGFRSLAPFNRSFKDHFGITPSEYRQKLQGSISSLNSEG
jgi:AraC-like DNA-binding protein